MGTTSAVRSPAIPVVFLAASMLTSFGSSSIPNPYTPDGNWTETAKLAGGAGAPLDVDGNVFVVGSFNETTSAGFYAGKAYVVSRTNGAWRVEAALEASDGAAYDQFGWDVAISGNTIAVSSANHDDQSGSVYVFVRDGETWIEQAELSPVGPLPFDAGFGWALDLEGETLAVSNGPYSLTPGAAYVFNRTGSSWAQTTQLLPGSPATFGSGNTVTISGDTVAVGVPGDDSGIGTVHVFVSQPSGWSLERRLYPDGSTQSASPEQRVVITEGHFGRALALEGDLLAVGEPFWNTVEGRVHVWRRDGAEWTRETVLEAGDGSTGNQLGTALDLGGEQLVVGAPGALGGGPAVSSAYVFGNSGGRWSELAKLRPSSDFFGSLFGYSLGIEAGMILVTARDGIVAGDRGFVFVFDAAQLRFFAARSARPTFGRATSVEGALR